MKTYRMQFAVMVALMLFIETAQATKTIDIVTDTWAPFAYERDGQIVGSDVEIALAVFRNMGIKPKIRLLPWKRALNLVKEADADAILDVSITKERKEFLNFPDEPVSEGTTVFFKLKNSPVSVVDLKSPEPLRVGAMLGYNYCEELDDSNLIRNASRVPTLRQNFKMLLTGRLQLVVEVESVGMHEAREMAIADQLAIVEGARYCTGGNYLAFARKPGYDELAEAFSEALIEFKKTEEYQDILLKYRPQLPDAQDKSAQI